LDLPRRLRARPARRLCVAHHRSARRRDPRAPLRAEHARDRLGLRLLRRADASARICLREALGCGLRRAPRARRRMELQLRRELQQAVAPLAAPHGRNPGGPLRRDRARAAAASAAAPAAPPRAHRWSWTTRPNSAAGASLKGALAVPVAV